MTPSSDSNFNIFSIQILFQTLTMISSVSLQLITKSVSEDPCPYPLPPPVTPTLSFKLEVLSRLNEPFYVPMGSQHLYRAYAEYLLGREPVSQNELNRMNLRIIAAPTYTFITNGFNRTFVQQCFPARAPFRAACFAGLGSSGTNMAKIRFTIDTMVWTDNESSFLFTRCVLGHINDWKVLSLYPKLPPKTQEEILDKISSLGYNRSLAAFAKY